MSRSWFSEWLRCVRPAVLPPPMTASAQRPAGLSGPPGAGADGPVPARRSRALVAVALAHLVGGRSEPEQRHRLARPQPARLARRHRGRPADAAPGPRRHRGPAAPGALGLAAHEIRRTRPPAVAPCPLGHRRGRRDRACERHAGHRPLAPADRPRRRGRRCGSGRRARPSPACPAGSAGAVLGFVFAGIAILSLTAACGLGPVGGRRHREEPEEFDAAAPRQGAADRRLGRGGRRRPDEPGWGIVSLGRARPRPHEPARHRAPLAGSAPARRESRRISSRIPAGAAIGLRATGAAISVLDGHPARGRAAARVPVPRRGRRGRWDDRTSVPPPRAGSSRPSPPRAGRPPHAGAPKPGKRMAREAQPSLLDEDELPAAAADLLAEPKRPPAPCRLDRRAGAERRACSRACSRISASAARSSRCAPARS